MTTLTKQFCTPSDYFSDILVTLNLRELQKFSLIFISEIDIVLATHGVKTPYSTHVTYMIIARVIYTRYRFFIHAAL